MLVNDTLEFLAGTWMVDRSIEDHRSGVCGHFQGSAVFALSTAEDGQEPAARASFVETGQLRFGEHVAPASRRLDYVRLDGAAMLYFTDGRPYTDLDLRAGTWHAEHQCAADHYAVMTVVRGRDELHEIWRVRGPRKDYDATTTLRRA